MKLDNARPHSSAHLLAAAPIIVLALFRHAYRLSIAALALGAFVLSVLGCLQSVGALRVPTLGAYLDRVPIEASITLVGILIAVFTASAAWRSQKRDELLLASLYDIEVFTDSTLRIASDLNGFLLLLKELQDEANAGPCSLPTLWRADYLAKQAADIQEKRRALAAQGYLIYGLDSRNVHALTSNPMVFRSFKKTKVALLGISDAAIFSVPSSSGNPSDFIEAVRGLPDNEYVSYWKVFHELTEQGGGGVGGVRGAIQAKFFPPSLTFAWALIRMKQEP